MTAYEQQVRFDQERLYARPWNEGAWNNECLFPPLLPLEEILRGSTARAHLYTEAQPYNVMGLPRNGTKWLQKILDSLLEARAATVRRSWLSRLWGGAAKPIVVGHFHEGVPEDYRRDQKVVFIYRDVRDAVVSGYLYVRNGLHAGTMDCTTENFARLSEEDGLAMQLVMYMKYRMPVMWHWYRAEAPGLVKVRYEDLLTDPGGQIRRLNVETGIGVDEAALGEVLAKVSFENMSGRERGAEDRGSHLRKGVRGDWRNHFGERHRAMFRAMGGEQFLEQMGYAV